VLGTHAHARTPRGAEKQQKQPFTARAQNKLKDTNTLQDIYYVFARSFMIALKREIESAPVFATFLHLLMHLFNLS